jgi:hypothetical protein
MISRNLRTSTLAVLAAFCSLAFLPGCSSQPKEALGRRGLELKLGLDKSKKLKLVSFKKTDGQSGEAFGIKMYNMSYAARIEVLETPAKAHIPARRGVLPESYQPPRDVLAASENGEPWQILGYAVGSIDEIKKGNFFDATGEMHFEKSENGWTVITGGESSCVISKHL